MLPECEDEVVNYGQWGVIGASKFVFHFYLNK